MGNTASGDNGTRYNKGAMAIHLEAVYEQGVLRPLEPLALVEHQQVHIIVDERKRPLSWQAAQQPDDSRTELDWLANESRHYTGEWVALDGNRLFQCRQGRIAIGHLASTTPRRIQTAPDKEGIDRWH